MQYFGGPEYYDGKCLICNDALAEFDDKDICYACWFLMRKQW